MSVFSCYLMFYYKREDAEKTFNSILEATKPPEGSIALEIGLEIRECPKGYLVGVVFEHGQDAIVDNWSGLDNRATPDESGWGIPRYEELQEAKLIKKEKIFLEV